MKKRYIKNFLFLLIITFTCSIKTAQEYRRLEALSPRTIEQRNVEQKLLRYSADRTKFRKENEQIKKEIDNLKKENSDLREQLRAANEKLAAIGQQNK